MNRYERKFYGRKRLKELKAITGNRFFSAKCWWNNNHLARIWRGKRSKQIKKKCNKALRRAKDVFNTTYHKVTEFWWELY